MSKKLFRYIGFEDFINLTINNKDRFVRPSSRNYERSNIKIKEKNQVKREPGIARCGLACFLCENDCHKGLLSKMKP